MKYFYVNETCAPCLIGSMWLHATYEKLCAHVTYI